MIIFHILAANKQEWCLSCQIMPWCPHSIHLCTLFLAKQLVLKTTDVQTWNFTFPWCVLFHLATKLCNLFFQKKKKNQLWNNWSRWTRWSYAGWKESQLFLKQKLVYAFNHPCCPSLNLFQIYYILSERKGPGLHTVTKVWVQLGFVWVHNDAFLFWSLLFISSSEFLTLDLLFWLLPRTELKFSSLSIKTKSGNDSSQSPSIYAWRKVWISHVQCFAFTYIEYYPVAKSPESLGQFSTFHLHLCCFE